MAIVKEAKVTLQQRKVQNAWALYYQAELLEYELKTKEELDARAGKILFESAILLNDGAKQNIRRLIGQGSDNGGWVLQKNVAPSNVIEARRIIQDYYIKKYTYLDVAMQMLSILTTIVAILSLIIAFTLTSVPNTITSAPASSVFWITIGLFGGVGGSISGLFGLKQSFALDSDMPERVLNKWITIAKPIIGFAAAIVIAIFLIAGFVEVANIEVSTYLIFSMAFVSGFSERLIIGAVSSRLPS